jgi:hypothetical protein
VGGPTEASGLDYVARASKVWGLGAWGMGVQVRGMRNKCGIMMMIRKGDKEFNKGTEQWNNKRNDNDKDKE